MPPFRALARAAAATTIVVALAGGGWAGGRLLAASEGRDASLDRQMLEYTEVLGALQEWSAEPLGADRLVFASIRGLVGRLDPHSSFFEPRDYSGVRDKQAGSYYGVGLLVTQREGKVVVVTPMEGGPAGRLGVRPGDVIIEVDGTNTTSMGYDKVTEMLRGERGTAVRMSIRREGFEDPLRFTIVREAITTRAVSGAFMLDDVTGYIRVNDFTATTAREFDEASAALLEGGMKRVIVDLRGNGGGLLGAAIEISDRFLQKDQMVVSTRGATPESNEQYLAPGRKQRLGIPLVVLVDHGSASASEIFAGAIQDQDRGLIVGQTTWGKGLVQSVYNLGHGAGLALTTARYYTPSGRNIQRDYSSLWDYYTSDESTGSSDGRTFTTATGRAVKGGGGIHPDVTAALSETPRFIQLIQARGLPFDFAVTWSASHAMGEAEPEVTPAMMEEFRALVLQREAARPSEIAEVFADAGLRERIRRMIEAEIVAVQRGYEAASPYRLRGDEQISAALGAFDEAEKLADQAVQERTAAKLRTAPNVARRSGGR